MHDYVSREEFESLQKELNYWQNTTITILKKYLIDNESKVTLNMTRGVNNHLLMGLPYTLQWKNLANVLLMKIAT